MRRVFTKPMCNGRYRAGDIRDYPLDTWRMFGTPDDFSAPVDETASMAVRTRRGRKETGHVEAA